jgi:hypothetical protein
MKTCGLNGWQRLGVVATVGWVFVVLVAVATSWNPHGMQNWLHVRPLPFQPDPLGLDMADLVWSRLAGLLGLPITLLWAVGFACAWIRSGFECGVEAPYLKPRRLQDVLALVQVLAVDVFSHRSEKWLCEELQRKPLSVKTWKALAGGLSEFLCARPRRLVHGGGRRLRRTTDAVGKSVVPCYAAVLMKRSP